MPEETEVRSREPMAVSLDLELLTLANATRGAEILADYQTRQGFMDDESEEDAPMAVFSILSLVGSRLEQLRRVIRGEENPEFIEDFGGAEGAGAKGAEGARTGSRCSRGGAGPGVPQRFGRRVQRAPSGRSRAHLGSIEPTCRDTPRKYPGSRFTAGTCPV
jgi:hypothetical protein